MGTTNHNAVIATTSSEECFDDLMRWLGDQPEELRKLCVTRKVPTNNTRTVCMVPDGSNHGWPASDRGDELRASFIDRLEHDRSLGAVSAWSWIEVEFGELGQRVLQGNNQDFHGDFDS